MRPYLLLIALAMTACDDKLPELEPGDDSPVDTGDGSHVDADGDLNPASVDCDDANPAVHPGAIEFCDGLDNDCDESVDEGVQTEFYADNDADGYGRGEARLACEAPDGWVATNTDCDDADARFHPDAEESDCADPHDYNCDGSVGYADDDSDGFAACQECDDGAAGVFPGAEELCDGIDNDCDESIDEELLQLFYLDADGDGYGDIAQSVTACELPEGHVTNGWDCDDADSLVSPGATEVCDDIDDNCDSLVDDADPSLDLGTASAWYADADGDGYGDPDAPITACDMPSGAVASADDCDDTEWDVYPGANEVCDGSDNDCDGLVDDADDSLDTSTALVGYADGDGDGYGDSAAMSLACALPSGFVFDDTDCDDSEWDIYPGASEACDGTDNDCDQSVDEGLQTPTLGFSSVDPTGSCAGLDNIALTVSTCGCSDVVVEGAFVDLSDGEEGQVVAATVTANGFELQWDDSPSSSIGSDCDLDIAHSVSVAASKSGTTLTVDVTAEITDYDAGNILGAGFEITDYGATLSTDEDYQVDEANPTFAQTFTYTCAF